MEQTEAQRPIRNGLDEKYIVDFDNKIDGIQLYISATLRNANQCVFPVKELHVSAWCQHPYYRAARSKKTPPNLPITSQSATAPEVFNHFLNSKCLSSNNSGNRKTNPSDVSTTMIQFVQNRSCERSSKWHTTPR